MIKCRALNNLNNSTHLMDGGAMLIIGILILYNYV